MGGNEGDCYAWNGSVTDLQGIHAKPVYLRRFRKPSTVLERLATVQHCFCSYINEHYRKHGVDAKGRQSSRYTSRIYQHAKESSKYTTPENPNESSKVLFAVARQLKQHEPGEEGKD